MIYVLHIEPAYKQARHYIGFTESDDVTARYQRHMSGRGNPLIKAAVAAGCAVVIAASFPGDRTDERNIKNRSNGAEQCPICREAWKARRREQQRIRRARQKEAA